MIYIPTSLDQPVGAALGVQAGFAKLSSAITQGWLRQSPQGHGGFAHLRLLSTETSIHRHDPPEARLAGHHFRVGLGRFLYRVVSILAETPLNTLKRSFALSRQAHANKGPVEASSNRRCGQSVFTSAGFAIFGDRRLHRDRLA